MCFTERNFMTTFTHLFLADGRVTLAVREHEDATVSVGIAWCNPKDQFSRALGREVALMPLDLPDDTKSGFTFSFKSGLKKKSMTRLKDEAVVHFQNHCEHGTILVPSWASKHKNYRYLHNRSNKNYTMSYDGQRVVVSDLIETTYSGL